MTNWISVEDKLPEKDIPVLTYDGNYFSVCEYWYDENNKHVFFNTGNPSKDYITHWMPLTNPLEVKDE